MSVGSIPAICLKGAGGKGGTQTVLRWLSVCLVQRPRTSFPHKHTPPLPPSLGQKEKDLLLVGSIVLFLVSS